jgi:(1->4)-alpha-D-glucan 1-alpha-D-glucosylmutase
VEEQTSADPDLARRIFEQVRSELLARQNIPLATYRLQFNRRFRFEDAGPLIPYLARLGVTDVYASPYLKATPGSIHGYDVIDHSSLNPEIGTEEEHQAFCLALASHQLGQVLDFVSNHMGIKQGNALWDDVLENGPSSLYAKYFDIAWDPIKEELKDKVLLPVLGDQYGIVLERGELKLSFHEGAFFVRYYDRQFPIAPRQYHTIIKHRFQELEKQLGAESSELVELQSILTAIEHLPQRTETDRAKVLERSREKQVIKRRLSALVAASPVISAFIEENLQIFNGTPGDSPSFDRLDAVLSQCSYRLAHWQVAGEEINYRRFFDINDLAAIRVEDPEVFEAAHALLFRWLAENRVTGLRIDHPDGLFDPTAYFLNLQERYFVEWARQRHRPPQASAESWAKVEGTLRDLFHAELAQQPDSPLARALYVVVEKIQGGKERIPEAWAIHGTTGYRFANVVSGLFVDPESESVLTGTYERFINRSYDFGELLYEKKKLIMSVSMASEINVLARELNRISEMNRQTRDFTLNALRRALVEVIALFPIYRTYVDGWRPEVDQRDRQYIEWTVARAKEKDLTTNVSIFDFLRDVLLRRYHEYVDPQEREVMLRFAMRLQQSTGPVMSKGLEDTVFYIYNRLTSLNEVGGEPQRLGTPEATFHLRNQERAEHWPASLLTTSTHDTKRSEDVRARINVISELPKEWRSSVQRWARVNRRYKTLWNDWLAPDPNDEYLFYQSVVGAWPMGGALTDSEWQAFRERIEQYMLKAVKEAKVHTSWINPDSRYEEAVVRFVTRTMDRSRHRRFVEDIEEFKQRLERPGQVNAISQVLLKIASPGTTDIYQGCEIWDLSLVDPDNRRPVDFELRNRLLEAVDREAEVDRQGFCRKLFADMTDGRIKLFVLSQGLRFRKRHEQLFRGGEYLPLRASGPQAGRVICFGRRSGDEFVVAVAPRLVTRLLEKGELGTAFKDTFVEVPLELAGARLRDVFTGAQFQVAPDADSGLLRLGPVLDSLPVSLLEKVAA